VSGSGLDFVFSYSVVFIYLVIYLFIYYKIVHKVQKYKFMQINEITRDS